MTTESSMIRAEVLPKTKGHVSLASKYRVGFEKVITCMALLDKGCKIKVIARDLRISPSTVRAIRADTDLRKSDPITGAVDTIKATLTNTAGAASIRLAESIMSTPDRKLQNASLSQKASALKTVHKVYRLESGQATDTNRSVSAILVAVQLRRATSAGLGKASDAVLIDNPEHELLTYGFLSDVDPEPETGQQSTIQPESITNE